MSNIEPKGGQELEAFTDTIPNLLKLGREQEVEDILLSEFEGKLPMMLRRYRNLHYLLFKTGRRFLQFLLEARKLYIEGFDWATVALCGMTVEAICISIINERITDSTQRKKLLELDCRKQIENLKEKLRIIKSGSLMHQILDVRNDYVHLKKEIPDPKEVLACLNKLHLVVIAEYGLVPWKNGKARLSKDEDLKGFAMKMGLEDLFKTS